MPKTENEKENKTLQVQEDKQRQRTNEEQMRSRQSAPRPRAEDEANKILAMRNKGMVQGNGVAMNGAVDGFRALEQPIGKEAVQKATLILQKYKEGKANLEKRIVDNEQWYKVRHWECLRRDNKEHKSKTVEPASAWLFNCIANKHADAMDNFPAPNILPREEGDKGEAEMLSSIIPVILDQNDFEKTYDEVWNYKLKSGTGVYGIFWDQSKLNGLGDISIQKIDLINLFWEPGITDIQKSRNFFHVELCDNDLLVSKYPQLNGKLTNSTIDVAKYVFDDNVDTTDKSVVVDWYYKKGNSRGKQILHYCKFVNDVVLYATENENNPQVDAMGNAVGEPMSEKGLYDHGRYPFEFDPLFRVEGTPAGFGYLDVGKSAQEYIDRGNQAVMQNMLANARPRHFINSNGSVNEEEYADITKDFVHVDGNLGTDSIQPIQANPLSQLYLTIIDKKIDELKETTGNRDISTGGTTSGVTAASAIAAMQEAGSKLSRDANKQSYRVFKHICLDVIELIRQFYDLPRCFRIMGQNGTARFVQYSNQGISPQMQGMDFGVDMGMRIPLFDVEVSAQKQSPYSKMSQNELALQFYNAGFFNPQLSDQALACLDMMDFDRKEFIEQKISQNGGMLQQMMMLAAMVDAQHGTNDVQMGIAQQYGIQMPNAGANPNEAQQNGNLGGSSKTEEAENTKKARQRVADATAPE